MSNRNEIVILGGGVIGLTTAYFLAREGNRVVVCEAGEVGGEASWAGAGIIPPSNLDHARTPFDRLRALSVRHFPAFSRELFETTNIDNGYRLSGGLEWMEGIGEAVGEEWYGEGCQADRIEPEALQRLEPAVTSLVGAAQHIPGMAQLRNPRHLAALKAGCLRTENCRFLEGTTVRNLHVKNGHVVSIETSTGTIDGDRFLIAAGAWSDQLLKPLGVKLHVEPVRGQIALLNAGQAIFKHILIWGARYLVPRDDGRVLVGSTEEWVGFEKRNTTEAIQDLLSLALKLVPKLASATLERCWSGLRPHTPDGLPYLGPVVDLDNLWVAAGHFRSGVQLSLGSALLMKEMLLGQPYSLPVEPFRLDRRGRISTP